MNWIDADLAVGDLDDARNNQELRRQGINVSIDVRNVFYWDETEPETFGLVKHKVWSLVDILRTITGKYKAFIHCRGGIDRAPFIAMLYVAKKYKKNYSEAYKWVKECRTQVIEHWEWVPLV